VKRLLFFFYGSNAEIFFLHKTLLPRSFLTRDDDNRTYKKKTRMSILVVAVTLIGATLLLKGLSFCANYTNTVGLLFARLFIWLQKRCNLMLIRKRLTPATLNVGAQTFIVSYGRWFYYVMTRDLFRMVAYINGIREATSSTTVQPSQKVTLLQGKVTLLQDKVTLFQDKVTLLQGDENADVWLDIGTGAHMPLTQSLLEAPATVVAHVHAVEANDVTYGAALRLKKTLLPRNRDRITLHNCYSTALDASTLRPEPTAVIHETIGTVASSEGAVAAIRAAFRMFPKMTKMFPHSFGTLCVPVSPPVASIASALASLPFGGATRVATDVGVQCLYNPSPDLWMSAPAIVESYDIEDMRSTDMKQKSTTVVVSITRAGYCSGLFLAPQIRCSAISDVLGVTTINGLHQRTNWGVEYLCFGHRGQQLEMGDQLTISFTANVDTDCPSYIVDVSCNSPTRPLVVRHKWCGPQDNMLI
jgi:hypothetical protein